MINVLHTVAENNRFLLPFLSPSILPVEICMGTCFCRNCIVLKHSISFNDSLNESSCHKGEKSTQLGSLEEAALIHRSGFMEGETGWFAK